MSSYARLHRLGVVLLPPFQVKLPHSGREPDAVFVAAEHGDRLKPTFLDGPADLVVELVSDESVQRDRVRKFEEYREAGIPEYWLIDPRLEQVEFYQLDGQGRYAPVAPDAEGIYRSRALPGFWLRVDWLWQQPLPDPVRVLLEIDGDAYLRYLEASR